MGGIWIIESKDFINLDEIDYIKDKIQQFYDYSWEIVEDSGISEIETIGKADELYGRLLLKYINNYPLNIKLTEKEL